MSTHRKNRNALTLRQKVAIIKAADGRPHRRLAEIYNIGKTQVRSIMLNKDNILKQAETFSPYQKRQLPPHKSDLNMRVYKWYAELLSQDQKVTGAMIKNKATQVAAELELYEFTATDGWLSRFKMRHLIGQKAVSSNPNDPAQGIDEQLAAKLPIVLQGFDPRNVFALDETSILYRALPSIAHASYASEPSERLTLLFCVNFSGEFQKSLAVSHCLHAPCFRTMDRSKDLPLMWRASKEGLMTADVFSEFVSALNNRMQLEDRHILLLLKANQSHTDTVNLTNVKIEFLPDVGKSILNHGLIQHIKILYRKQLLEHVIEGAEALSDGSQQPNASYIVGRVTYLQALYWLDNAIKQQTPHFIQKCFCEFYADTEMPTHSLQLECTEIEGDNILFYERCQDAFVALNIRDPMSINDYCEIDSLCPVHSQVETTSPVVFDDTGDNEAESSQQEANVVPARPLRRPNRKTLNLRQKVAIIQAADGRTQRQLADTFEIGKSQVWNILQNRDAILNKFIAAPDSNVKRIRKRSTDMIALDDKMFEWYKMMRARSDKVSGVAIRMKALELAAQLNLGNFCASSGWLVRFKERHSISDRRVSTEQAVPDIRPAVANMPDNVGLPAMLNRYPMKDVFAMGETAFLYRALPDKTLAVEERLTLSLCVNSEGEFQKSWLIGSRKCPPCFKKIERRFLPLSWRANKLALMTAELFQEWLTGFNHRMVLENRYVLLLVTKRLSHPRLTDMSNVKIKLLPYGVEIIDDVFISKLKGYYRQQLLEHLISKSELGTETNSQLGSMLKSSINDGATSVSIDKSDEHKQGASRNNLAAGATSTPEGYTGPTNTPYTTMDMMKEVDVHQAMGWLDVAINRMCTKMVQRSFQQSGIYPDISKVTDEDMKGTEDGEQGFVQLQAVCEHATKVLRLSEPMTASEYCTMDAGLTVHDNNDVHNYPSSSDNEPDDDESEIKSEGINSEVTSQPDLQSHNSPAEAILPYMQLDMDSENIHTHVSVDRHRETLSHELWKLRNEGVMCDAMLDVDGEVLLAHRIILSACSPYLKTCCLNPSMVAYNGMVQIRVTGFSYKVCLKLIEFLYTGRLLDSPHSEFLQLCTEWQIVGMRPEDNMLNSPSKCKPAQDCNTSYNTELNKYGSVLGETVKQDNAGQQTKTSDMYPYGESSASTAFSQIKDPDHRRSMYRPTSSRSMPPGDNDPTEPIISIAVQHALNELNRSKIGKKENSAQMLSGEQINTCGVMTNDKTDKTTGDSDNMSSMALLHRPKPIKKQKAKDSFSPKGSNKLKSAEVAQDNSNSSADLAPQPPLLTEEWISSCFKEKNTATENQQLYDGDTCESESAADSNGLQSDSDADTDIHPKSQSSQDKSPQGQDDKPQKKLPKPKAKTAVKKKTPKGLHAKRLNLIRNGECGTCGDKFDTPAQLYLHRVTLHRNKHNGWCKICKLRFPDKNKLQVHNVSNHFEEGMEMPKIYACQAENCGFTTYSRKSIFSHKKIVHNTERSICDLCGKSLKSEYSLKQHHKHVHSNNDGKEYPCLQCNRIFKFPSGLQRHLLTIHSDASQREKHICPHCGHTSFNISTMTEHLFKKHDILSHGKKSYKCKHCAFKTTKIRDIRNHEFRHEPEKKFRCDQCPRCYPTSREVNRHKRLKHPKNQEVELMHCDQCEYSTKYGKAALRSHIVVKHQDNRPWICSICTYSTKLKGNLHKHIRNVHKCEVKTNWMLPKVMEDGQLAEGYTNQPGPSASRTQADYSINEADMSAITPPNTNPAPMQHPRPTDPTLISQYDMLTSMGASPPSLSHVRISTQAMFPDMTM